MWLQSGLDALIQSMAETRAKYQMTIGKAITALSKMPKKWEVKYVDEASPGDGGTYRGYYHDFAFEDKEGYPVTVKELLDILKETNGTEHTGYKGGEYLMTENTPIWRSEWGHASGVAWMRITREDGYVLIETEKVD